MDQSRPPPRCCCRNTVVPPGPVETRVCEKVVGIGCSNKKPCGKDGICVSKRMKCPKADCCPKGPRSNMLSNMLQLLTMKDRTTEIESNMDMFDTESMMGALEYGYTVYRNSTLGI